MQPHSDHANDLNTPPEAQRRLLDTVNGARRPEDLEELDACGLDHELRGGLLARRDRMGAYGFTDIKQLTLDPRITVEILKRLTIWFGPSRYGRWDMVGETTLSGARYNVAHAAVLNDGRVLFLPEADTVNTLLWDPEASTDALTVPANQPSDVLFCSGHSFLSDGQLLCVGGGGNDWDSASTKAWRFNPSTQSWTKTAGELGSGRWYPTAVTMGRKRKILVVSGYPATATAEVYDESSDDFVPVTGSASSRNFPQLYPGLHLLPGGEVFYSRTGWGSERDRLPTNAVLRLADPAAGEWTELADRMESADRQMGMSVLLIDSCHRCSVLVVGGLPSRAGVTAEMIRLTSLFPTWEPATTIPPGVPRTNVNAVMLPDSSVFVVGGTADPAVPCALFNPLNPAWRRWSEMANANYVKRYHSVAVLLPSGKVLATGGSSGGGGSNVLEVFSPPYLFTSNGLPARRPTIDTAPAAITPQSDFSIETPQAADIAKVVLVRPMAVTHQTDSEQRVVPVEFHRVGTALRCHLAVARDEPAIAPLGYYMLFVLDRGGVPSVARFVKVE